MYGSLAYGRDLLASSSRSRAEFVIKRRQFDNQDQPQGLAEAARRDCIIRTEQVLMIALTSTKCVCHSFT
jgi:hypothetical protein